ncbi:YczE/YyaS/YitT family protein [Mediterraneibacter agrestimuris]|uniref:YczE/YyaS/YitT family protein n=1 Tax=Mediterraneibacter agrestimuris TaxID=2941333 RepID=UPI00203B4234|nr:YitT family protein [Mediterraneibacter agrestimuris]
MQDNQRKIVQNKNEKQFAADTSNRSMGDWAKALVILLIGLAIAHLGVTLFLLSDLGTDTFTVFAQGLARRVGISVGMMQMTVVCVLMIIMLLTTKGYVKPGTVVCALCGGPIIDFFTWILGGYINGDSAMIVRIISVVAGCVILSLGMSVVINSNAGTGPNDLVAIILTDKIRKIEFRWVRMACDVFFVVLGFVLGGTVGVGTIVAVFLTGPLVQFWLPKTKKIVNSILREV